MIAARVAGVPEPVELSSVNGATAQMTVERGEGEITVARSVRIPRMRIEPDAYPGFARFCRSFDEAETAELRVVP